MVIAWNGLSPIGVFSVGASFLIVGTTKEHVLIGSTTLRIFRRAFLKEELFSILNWFRPEQGSRPKGGAPKRLASRIV